MRKEDFVEVMRQLRLVRAGLLVRLGGPDETHLAPQDARDDAERAREEFPRASWATRLAIAVEEWFGEPDEPSPQEQWLMKKPKRSADIRVAQPEEVTSEEGDVRQPAPPALRLYGDAGQGRRWPRPPRAGL